MDVTRRLRLRIRGAVQGVGFRPFVHGLAERHGLSGFVLNDSDGVLAEVQGTDLDSFLAALHQPPPRARIDRLDVTPVPLDPVPLDPVPLDPVPLDPVPLNRQGGFAIRDSIESGAGQARAVPDAAPCQACVDDLFDRSSRFHLYPFVTCNQCGPRFTITKRMPYDRANTSMAGFSLCLDCESDYSNPLSRRFHAEIIGCEICGPQLSHPIAEIAAALLRGEIVALKGLGGFQLLCDAANDAAVATLRHRKHRPAKPFAVMVASAASAAAFAAPTTAELALLAQPGRPIVLLRARSALAAPGLDRVGVMLPSTPVHHLLFHALAGQAGGGALIATSANAAGEPLINDNAEAVGALRGIADLVVTHDRPIIMRADDSVMRVIDGAPALIRRSRGFVPEPIDLGLDGPAVLATGGHLKATLCVTRGREAFMSQHIGDLTTAQTIRFHADTTRDMLKMLGVTPEIVACDQHPDYRSTRYAEATGLPILRVQHHAAHLAAVAAEHNVQGDVLGVALDGHGYGDGGAAWGGELLLLQGAAARRLGHLLPLKLPGGDRAAREPWRMGIAALDALGRGDDASRVFPTVAMAGQLAAHLAAASDSPVTTSMGRLFDAAAALLGVCTQQSYEGQAAMELEALVGTPQILPFGYGIADHVLDFRPLLSALLTPGLRASEGAALFHGTLIEGLAAWISKAALKTGHKTIALGGGCLCNRVLADGLAAALRERGLMPLLARVVPPNDGGLALGQAALARAHLMTVTAQVA